MKEAPAKPLPNATDSLHLLLPQKHKTQLRFEQGARRTSVPARAEMAFREQAQAQARHRIADTKVKAGGLAKSLRDQKHRVAVMGKLGVMHQLFGGLRDTQRVVHSMFEHVNGLSAEADAYDSDDDENALKSKKKISDTLAEAIYVPAITGDDAALEQALAPLIEQVNAYEEATAAGGGDQAEAAAAPPPAKGKPDPKAAKEPEPDFDPNVTLDARPPELPQWSIRDARGIEPLALAAARGHAGAVKLLLDARANVDARARTCGRSALHRAAEEGHTECVTILVERGADVLSTQHSGECALHSAAAGGHLEMVRTLLKSGAAVEQRDLGGVSALIAASEAGRLEVCKVLLAGKADVNDVDGTGWKAIHHAAKGGHEDVALELFRAGSDVLATRGGNTLSDLHGGIAKQVEDLMRARQRGGKDDDDDDDDDDDEGGEGRPYTAP